MESKNTVLLQIDFQGSGAIKQAADLKQQLVALNAEKKALTDLVKNGNQLSKEETVQLELLNAQIKENQRETRTLTKFIDDSTKANKAQVGSIEANRAKLSQLTAEYIKTANPTKEQTKNIKDLSAKLKEQEGAIGDNRRSVGGYSEALNLFGGKLSFIKDGLEKTKNGLKLVEGGFGGLRAAIVATGIGALVIGLTSLISFLQKTEKGAEFLERTMAGLGAAFNVLVGVAAKAGETIVEVFTKPQKIIESLGNFLSHPIDSIKAFGKGISDTANSALEAGKAIASLTGEIQDLDDAERESLVALSKNETKINQLILQAKNRTLAEGDRIKLLKEASSLEEENLNTQVTLANKRLELINKENAQKKRDGLFKDADDQKRVDAELKIEELKRNSISLQEKISNREDALLEASSAKRQKAVEDEAKDLERRLKLAQDGENEFKKLRDDALAQALKDNELYSKDAILQQKQLYADGIISEEEYQESINQIKLDSLNKQLEELINSGDNSLEAQSAIQEKEIEIANTTADAQIEAKKKETKETKRINKEAEQSEIDLANLRQSITQASLTLAGDFVNGVQGLLLKDEANRAKYGKALKALAIAEIGINLSKELSAIAATSAANPTNALSFGASGITQYTIQSAIAIVRSAFAVAQVTTQKLEQGGGVKAINIDGKRHSEGGEDVIVGGKRVANIEGGENMYILKRSASDYVNKLSHINQAFGGNSFGGTPVTRAADGGFIQTRSSDRVNQQMTAIDLANAIKSMPTPVVRVSEINSVQGNLKTAIAVSTL